MDEPETSVATAPLLSPEDRRHILDDLNAYEHPSFPYRTLAEPFEEQVRRLNEYVAYTPIENVAGAPSISLPMGMSRDVLPVGMQFATKPGGWRVLLELAFELERELEWYRNKPPLWVGE